ncbi:hypothetical protein MBLNU459_g3604t1 [Dothideomycetes sp. NU459]
MSPATSPSADAASDSKHAAWLPADIPYSAAYENAVKQAIVYPPPRSSGIRILRDGSAEEAQPGISVRASDIDPASLPDIAFDDLPLPLDDKRRIYASPLPGINLTHPGGYFEGGPGFAPNHDAFAAEFITQFNIGDATQLHDAVEKEIGQHIEVARERMAAREAALQQNARIEKEIKTLMDQREMEVKIEAKIKDEAKARRERRERKKDTR